MAKKREHPIREVVPPEADDLQVINGIGPAVEHRLHGVGIYTFAQLAALTPADIAASVADLTGLTAERIIRQNWIGQARRLAAVTGPMQDEEESAPVLHEVPENTETSEEAAPAVADAELLADEETAIIGEAEDVPADFEESADVLQEATVEDAPFALPQPAQSLTGTLQIRAMELVGSTAFGSHRRRS